MNIIKNCRKVYWLDSSRELMKTFYLIFRSAFRLWKIRIFSRLRKDMKRVLADDGVGIFAFTSLDDVAFASKLLNKYSLSSTLYKDSENQCYYFH